MEPRDFIKTVLKGWGREDWIQNNQLYCAKLMTLNPYKKCSWHFHWVKDETFFNHGNAPFLLSVVDSDLVKYWLTHQVDLDSAVDSACTVYTIHPNESFRIPPHTLHRFQGLGDRASFLETSTHHREEDVYRVRRGD